MNNTQPAQEEAKMKPRRRKTAQDHAMRRAAYLLDRGRLETLREEMMTDAKFRNYVTANLEAINREVARLAAGPGIGPLTPTFSKNNEQDYFDWYSEFPPPLGIIATSDFRVAVESYQPLTLVKPATMTVVIDAHMPLSVERWALAQFPQGRAI